MNNPSSRSEAVIETRGLTRRFASPTPIEAVRNVSFALQAGEIVALMGPSGSGKSTLLAMLGALLAPTSGSVMLDGTDLTSIHGTELARIRNTRVGFVFQFHHLLPELTALENVFLPALFAAREGWLAYQPGEIEDRARSLLSAVGLQERSGHYPTQLSGGEAQRVAIARALMNRPAVIFADEPTGNLDRDTAIGIMDLFKSLNQSARQTFLVATHNVELAKRASRTLNLMAGELAK